MERNQITLYDLWGFFDEQEHTIIISLIPTKMPKGNVMKFNFLCWDPKLTHTICTWWPLSWKLNVRHRCGSFYKILNLWEN